MRPRKILGFFSSFPQSNFKSTTLVIDGLFGLWWWGVFNSWTFDKVFGNRSDCYSLNIRIMENVHLIKEKTSKKFKMKFSLNTSSMSKQADRKSNRIYGRKLRAMIYSPALLSRVFLIFCLRFRTSSISLPFRTQNVLKAFSPDSKFVLLQTSNDLPIVFPPKLRPATKTNANDFEMFPTRYIKFESRFTW